MLSVSLASLQDQRVPQLWASYQVCLPVCLVQTWLTDGAVKKVRLQWSIGKVTIASGLFFFNPSYLGNDSDKNL